MEPAAGAHPVPERILFNRPPRNPVTLPLLLVLPLDDDAAKALASPRPTVSASIILNSYRESNMLPPTTPVDLCDAIKGAVNWAPSASTMEIPLYVSMSYALHPKAVANCTGVKDGPVPLDDARRLRIISTFGRDIARKDAQGTAPFGPQTPSAPSFSPQPNIGDLQRAAAVRTQRPMTVTFGEPDAYYLKTLLEKHGLKPTYRFHAPDRYLLVDFAISLDDHEDWTFQSATFTVRTSLNPFRILAHEMIPDRLEEDETRTMSYEIGADGNVRAIPLGAKVKVERTYQAVVPVLVSFNRRQSDFYWRFTRGRIDLVGNKNISALLELPPGLQHRGFRTSLRIDVRLRRKGPGFAVPAALPQYKCYDIVLQEDPVARECPQEIRK